VEPSGLETREVALRAKQGVDIVLAFILLVLTSPVLILAMIAIRLTGDEPVIFRQRRVGFRQQEFVMYKLRTMTSQAPPSHSSAPPASSRSASGSPFEGESSPGPAHPSAPEPPGAPSGGRIFEKVAKGDARVTRVGRILRNLSLDELPQLLNVLRGDMSLVGPRPLLLSDMRAFPDGRAMLRFQMKPGLTGLWQVSGRSLLSDLERIRLDLEYVERWSPWLDFTILLRTPLVVALARGAV